MARLLIPDLYFSFNEIEVQGKRVVVLDIPAAKTVPTSFDGNGITGYHDEALIEKETVVIGRVGFYCGSVHITPKKAPLKINASTLYLFTLIPIFFATNSSLPIAYV